MVYLFHEILSEMDKVMREMDKVMREMNIYFFIYKGKFKQKAFFTSRNGLNSRRNGLSVSQDSSRNG